MSETVPPGGPPESAGASREGPWGRYTILLVEDEPDAREYMKAFLEAEGYRFLHAASGAQALALVASCVPDLVIVDFMMPGMTGLELCEKLRARPATRRVPILVFSAYPLNPRSNAGLYDHAMTKPADFADLLRAIRGLLAATTSG